MSYGKTILIEDVITTGKSIKEFMENYKNLNISGILVVVDRREKPVENFMNIRLFSLIRFKGLSNTRKSWS
ncbi:hypothetical protein BH10PAT1_BH10PAT1_2570 [soil metagenome]